MRIKFIKVIAFIFLTGCNNHALKSKAILVRGCVIDEVTKHPIPNAKVTVLCWYQSGWDKNDYVSIDTTTDLTGCYSVNFEEGYKVVVASIAVRHYPKLKECAEINKERVVVNLALARKSIDDTAHSHLNLRYFIIENSSN